MQATYSLAPRLLTLINYLHAFDRASKSHAVDAGKAFRSFKLYITDMCADLHGMAEIPELLLMDVLA